MMRRLFLAASLALAATSILPGIAGAHETVPAEKRILPYSSDLPLCGDPSVLAFITSHFAEKETAFWKSDLKIVEYSRITPTAYRPWGVELIPRRFCTATAKVSDGRVTPVDYSVREDLDFIGNGWSVEWCARGLDRNLAYSPNCRMARP